MKHARITVTSPDRPAQYLEITDDGYRIAARWVPIDDNEAIAQWQTIMEYKHSGATSLLVYATVAALFDSLPVTMHLPIAATDSSASGDEK